MTTYSACTCHKRPSLDEKYPPNETPAALALWNLATTPDETIPAGTLFVEKWSNGHYGPPEMEAVEILPTDNIGPDFTCERRVLAPVQENPRPLTPDAITDEMVLRFWNAFNGLNDGLEDMTLMSIDEVRTGLSAALTEPPARPEGAEEIEAYMRELVASHPEDHYGELADHLASRGVLPPITDKTNPEEVSP